MVKIFLNVGWLLFFASCSLQLNSIENPKESPQYFFGKWLWAPHFQGNLDISENSGAHLVYWSHENYSKDGIFYKEYFLSTPDYPTIQKPRYIAWGKWQTLSRSKSIQITYDSCALFDHPFGADVIQHQYACPNPDTLQLKFVGGFWIRPFYDPYYGSTIQKWKKLNVD